MMRDAIWEEGERERRRILTIARRCACGCDEAHAKLAKVRQELAATVECDCGRCAARRIADAIGGVPR